jgi:hypothetical protein
MGGLLACFRYADATPLGLVSGDLVAGDLVVTSHQVTSHQVTKLAVIRILFIARSLSVLS